MEENDEITTVTDTVETPDPARTPVEYVRKTRADRLRENAQQPDFAAPKAKTTDMVFKESVMNLTPSEINEIVRNSGIKGSAWEQTGVAIENALTNMNQLPDELSISVGNLANYITGGQIGQELQDVAFESLKERMADVQLNNESVGGVSNLFAQIAGGSVSFIQLALEGLATGGYLSLAHIGAQSFGEGVYNDMKKYADEHDGSLKGYRPNGIDLAINTANMIMQVAIEERLGVGSPRFLRGWSRGFWKEAGSGFVQEAAQGLLSDFAEVLKGNEDAQVMMENADQYLLDGLIGAILQGPLGAVTYSQARRRSDNIIAMAHAQVKGRKEPIKEDFDVAKKVNDAKERNYMTAFTEEFKAAFDASTGEGQLQANIAKALNDAVAAQELDLGVDDETERAQRVEQIATQETLNAMEQANEQGKSIAEMGISNIVYKDGAIWVEGLKPEVGERAVEYASVLAARQTGLAEAQTKLDSIQQELQQTKKDLAEAKAQSKQALADKLQARLDKQNALAEKRKVQAEQLKAQTEKIQRQIAKELEKAPKQAETKVEEVKAVEEPQKAEAQVEMPGPKVEVPETKVESAPAKEEPKAEPKPLAKVAEKTKKYKGEKKSLKAEREAQKKAKAKKTHGEPMEDWTGKTNVEIADARIKQVLGSVFDELQSLTNEDGVIVDSAENQPKVIETIQNIKWEKVIEALMAKYDIDPSVENWLRSSKVSKMIADDPDLYQTNLEALIAYLEDTSETEGGFSEMPVYDYMDNSDYYTGENEKLMEKNDYQNLFRVPKTLEELETKILNYIGNQYMEAVEYDTGRTDILPDNWFEVKPEQPYLFQSKVEGTGSDTKRGGYDDRLKRIILKDDADLTTIQHEFAHYWIQNNFKWARSGLASPEWLRKWRDVEEALGIEPQDRFLSKQASEKFARAYERYIMEGKVAEDLQWAFEGFQKFYQDTYEDLESEYFDLSEELDPAIVDWFNRQRPATEAQLKQNAYKKVATVAMAQGASIVTPVNENVSVVSNMNENGDIESQVITTDAETKDSKLAKFSDKKKARRTVEGLREINPDVKTDQYNVLNRAQTVEEAHNWIVRDRAGAWAALNDETTNPIDRTALFQAFKNEAENGDYALGAELAGIKFPKEMTELGQAISVLGERPEFDPLTILEEKQKSLGEPTTEEMATQTNEMGLDADLDAAQVKDLEETTECVL